MASSTGEPASSGSPGGGIHSFRGLHAIPARTGAYAKGRYDLPAGIAKTRSHLPVVAEVLGKVAVKVFDRHPDRAKAFVASARGQPGVASAGAVATARDAAGEATVVIAAGGISKAQEMTPDWLTPGTLVVAVDFATYVSAEIAKAAHSFAVDDRAQFLAYRDAGYFDGFPDPSETLGEALDRGTDRPRGGPVVVAHLGVGTADILFANEVLRTAQERGIGTSLSR